MKKITILILGLSLMFSCSSDDDGEGKSETPLTFDYIETLNGDLSNEFNTPTVMPFVMGENFVTAGQGMGDVDYFTFTVPENYELSEIIMDDYQSNDDAAFIGLVNGGVFPADAQGTESKDLLGGSLYGNQTTKGTNILSAMGEFTGVQGFSGSLPSGTYSIWLNQTGQTSEASFNFVISKVN